MSERVNKLYNPAAMRAALDALMRKHFTEAEAIDIIKCLHVQGFRIVKVTDK